jgi:energy-coupling factor transporter ATP-binding protein EcfA2
MTICMGEFIILLGRSGGRKSAFLTILGGLDVPTAGRVLYQGEDFTAVDGLGRKLIDLAREMAVDEFCACVSEKGLGVDVVELPGLDDRGDGGPAGPALSTTIPSGAGMTTGAPSSKGFVRASGEAMR